MNNSTSPTGRQKLSLLNYIISKELPDSSSDKKLIVNTINPHSYCVATKDVQFKKALQQSDYLLPDGIGIVFAAKFLKNEKISKIAGYDVFVHLMRQLNETSGSCFFLGASQDTLNLISARIEKDFPQVKVYTHSPPYKPVFAEEDSHRMRKAVNTVKPDVLFVGMTAPKQEKWVHQNKSQLDASIICSIGAVFDFYAGTVKRPSQFWIKLGLEWLPRFVKEPKRLAERNLISTPKFILEVFKSKFKQN